MFQDAGESGGGAATVPHPVICARNFRGIIRVRDVIVVDGVRGDDVYRTIFVAFDRKWNRANVGYMKFGQIFTQLTHVVEDILSKKPKSLKEFQRMIDNRYDDVSYVTRNFTLIAGRKMTSHLVRC